MFFVLKKWNLKAKICENTHLIALQVFIDEFEFSNEDSFGKICTKKSLHACKEIKMLLEKLKKKFIKVKILF